MKKTYATAVPTARCPYTTPRTLVVSAAAPTLLAASGDDPTPDSPDVQDDIWADDIEML